MGGHEKAIKSQRTFLTSVMEKKDSFVCGQWPFINYLNSDYDNAKFIPFFHLSWLNQCWLGIRKPRQLQTYQFNNITVLKNNFITSWRRFFLMCYLDLDLCRKSQGGNHWNITAEKNMGSFHWWSAISYKFSTYQIWPAHVNGELRCF